MPQQRRARTQLGRRTVASLIVVAALLVGCGDARRAMPARVPDAPVFAATVDAPIGDIVGPTTADVLTLITCDGAFSRNAQEYDKRRVVRAHRVS